MGSAVADWDGAGQNHIHLTHEVRFPHSLGLLYSAFTAFLGFEVNEGKYKVMGMAPYGQPRFEDEVYKLIRVAADGGFRLDMDYFSHHYSTTRSFSRRFEDLFGKPRGPGPPFITRLTNPDVTGNEPEAQSSQHYADLAASIQRVTEGTLLKMANHLHKETGAKSLCMSGGVALNSVANGRIFRETGFTDLFIHPAPGDSGATVGAALYAWHVLLGKRRRFVLEHAFLGQDYTEDEVHAFLKENNIRYEVYEREETLCDRIVDDLKEGRVVGLFQGRFEWGPRALGNRSILADPRRPDMKHIVNSKIKFRAPFRPFAPMLLEERAGDFFEGLTDPPRHYPARYMLLVMPWKDSMAERLPAVNHMGTGRLQTLSRKWNPRCYRLVQQFGEATGIPALLNTSFNLRGEPIVCSPADAWRTFSRSGLDVLVLGNCVVRKQES